MTFEQVDSNKKELKEIAQQLEEQAAENLTLANKIKRIINTL